MPPPLTRLLVDARQPSAEDYDPGRLAVPISSLLDGDDDAQLSVHLSAETLIDNVQKYDQGEAVESSSESLKATPELENDFNDLSKSSDKAEVFGVSDANSQGEGNDEKETSTISCDPAIIGDLNDVVGTGRRLVLHKKRFVAKQKTPSASATVIRVANVASGRIHEVIVQAGITALVANQQQNLDDVSNIGVDDITHLISRQLPERLAISQKDENPVESAGQDARLCEAAIRSVFAPKPPFESSNESLSDAATVREAFSLSASSYAQAEARAIHVAQYRRAEVQAMLDAVQNDQDTRVNPSTFEDPSKYYAWKEQEIDRLTELFGYLGTLASFSGSVQVDVISAEDLKPANLSWISQFQCSRRPPSLQVYASVTILPAKPGIVQSDSDSSDGASRKPAFLTEVVMCSETADWQGKSPWIPVFSMQDRVLIEVWERLGASKIIETDPKLQSRRRRSSKIKKVAPWSGDLFLGQVVISFSHIESQALADGGLQGMAPATSYMLGDEKGRQHMSTIQLQFACSSVHCYRDAPSNKFLLKAPIEDVGNAYDSLVRLAYQSEKEGYQLGEQWRRILRDFGNHYRVRKERCSLGMVQVLAGKFQHNAQYLNAVINEWLPVCTAAKEGRLTKSELGIHSHIVALLAKPAVEAVENFQSTFPGNQPPGALSKLLELLGLILRWDPSPNDVLIPLKMWIEASCMKRMIKNLFCNAAGDKVKNISLQSLVETVKLVRDDIHEHGTTYYDVFPADLILPAVTAPAYYKMISQYARSFVAAAPANSFTKAYGDLAAQLLQLHGDIEKIGVRVLFLDIHTLFKENIVQWLTAFKPRLISWVSSIVNGEKWEPLSARTNAFYSFSVVDLYFMMIQVTEELTTRLLMLPFGKHYVWHMEVAISAAVQMYVGMLEKLCLQELPEEKIKEKTENSNGSNSVEDSAHLCISKSMCIKLNNMNAVLQQQHDFESSLDQKWQAFGGHADTQKFAVDDEDLYMDEEEPAGEHFSALNRDTQVEHKVGGTFEGLKLFIHQTLDNVIRTIVQNVQWRLRTGLHRTLYNATSITEIDARVQPLTEFLDQHIIIMNECLHPDLFRHFLKEIAGALFFCMEEFALNRDENSKPMTPDQRKQFKDMLTFSYDYFYGDGLGISSSDMDKCSARLRLILTCGDLSTRELCSLYWQAWDKFNKSLSHVQEIKSETPASEKDQIGNEINYREETLGGMDLHVLEYLLLLKQRQDDEEAQELVLYQSELATNKTMQFMFGLPGDEAVMASFSCRNAAKRDGTLFITTKSVGFAEANIVPASDTKPFLLSLESLMRVDASGGKGGKSLIFVSLDSQSTRFTKFSDTDTVCRAIFKQVVGRGTILEKNMVPIWAEKHANTNTTIREFECSKQGLLRKRPGTLLILTTHVIFEREEKHKRLSIDHGSIIRIHAEKKGLRPSGVVIELKTGENFEFVDFRNTDLSPTEIALELQKLVLGGSVRNFHKVEKI